MFARINSLINQKKAKVAVMGLGYVGLPTAFELARAGFTVYGIDIQKERVSMVNLGKSYISDVSSQELDSVVKSGRLKAFSNPKILKKADVVLICVPTPLNENKNPDISYIVNTVDDISKYLHKGQMVILESSTYPGTTKEVILPKLEETGLKVGKDYFLAFSPERIDPGNKDFKFNEVPRLAGGVTKKCTDLAVEFYKSFLKAKVIPVSSPETAELTKIYENTFRLVNISFVNEMALLCGKMGIDIWEVIEAAKTKPYGFMPFYPSPKIGGHCIPIGPFFLSFRAKKYNFRTRFIELAGEINDSMPHSVITKIIFALNSKGKSVNGSKILIWGVSYKNDIGDTREAASHDIIGDLLRKKGEVDFFDPYVPEFRFDDHFSGKKEVLKSVEYSLKNLRKYDLVLILVNHSGFDYEEIAKNSNLVVDTRNAIKSRRFKNVVWL